jgi:hypothetical protein
MQKLILVFWPSFWVAVLAEMVFFAVVDPRQLYLFDKEIQLSPIATYSVFFLGFWLICALSCWATLFYARGSEEINHLKNSV